MQEYSKQRRRRHSAEFKAEVLQACEQPGASTAGVALAFGLNANLVRQWRRGRGVLRAGLSAPAERAASAQRFVPLELDQPSPPTLESTSRACDAAAIDVQLRRGDLAVSVRWPAGNAAACARLLRELLR
jgi:transposase